jgi:hypothetical protein
MILEFFARHRTAYACHVQRQFSKLFGSHRLTRMHLQTLVAVGDLHCRQTAIGQPNVYLVTAQGLRSHQRRADPGAILDPPPRHALPSGRHLVHELLITEIAVAIIEAARKRPDLFIPWEERFGFVRHPAFQELIPDYGFLLQHAHGLLVCLVEVFSGEESPTRMGQKLRAYDDWASGTGAQEFLTDLYRAHGAREPRPQFRLLVVAHDRRSGNDQARLAQLLLQASAVPRVMRDRIWIAAVSDLSQATSIDDPLWIRARDLHDAAVNWESLPARERRRHVRAVLPTLPRHRLFPISEGAGHIASTQN